MTRFFRTAATAKAAARRSASESQDGPGDPSLLNHEWCSSKAQINGTTAHVTAIFGMTLSGLIINDIFTSTIGNK